jgi:DNA invertase Pin-like site-specific DNA recombinase
VLHLYAALAEKERGMISERTKAALAAANDGQIDSEVAGFEDNLRSVSEDWRRERDSNPIQTPL